MRPEKIVSGGQSGADRAALDAAIAAQVPHGGWCPKGRWAEDGPIDVQYQLLETDATDVKVRTEANVIDADATVVFSVVPELTGGTRLTADLAQKHDRPLLKLHAIMGEAVATQELRAFIAEHRVAVLNVAGPRASTEPGIYDFVYSVLLRVLAE